MRAPLFEPAAQQVAQRFLAGLADAGFRKARHEFDAIGNLERGEPVVAQMPLQRERGRRGRARDDERARALAEQRIGHRDERRVADLRMREQQVLDFLGGYFFAAAIDLVLVAALDDEVAFFGAAHAVAAAIEAVGRERGRMMLGEPVVAADRIGPAHLQFADLARRDGAARLVDDAHFVGGRHRPTLRTRDARGRIVEPRAADEAFGHSEYLLQPAAEDGRHAFGRVVHQPRAADLQHAQARQVRSALALRVQPQ
ncbi:Uncharacterised protein [Burkholderia pseudomallei]|nr:Uncharacterised protein [Burkholderia pseudomallei]